MFSKSQYLDNLQKQDPEAIEIIYNTIMEMIPPSKSTKDDALVLSYNGFIITEPFLHNERIFCRIYTPKQANREQIVISLNPFFIRRDEGKEKFLKNFEIEALKELCLKCKDKALATPEQIEIVKFATKGKLVEKELAKISSYAMEEMIIKNPEVLKALADGLLSLSNFTNKHPSYLYFLTQPSCLEALKEGLFSAELLDFIFDSHTLKAIQRPYLLQALREQLFTLVELIEFNIGDKLIYTIGTLECLTMMRKYPISLKDISDLEMTPTALYQLINTKRPRRYLEALKQGLFTINELEQINAPQRIDAILRQGCLQGLREKLFSISDLQNIRVEKIKNISSIIGLQALRDGLLTLETMLEVPQKELEELLENIYYSSVPMFK